MGTLSSKLERGKGVLASISGKDSFIKNYDRSSLKKFCRDQRSRRGGLGFPKGKKLDD